MLKKQIILFFAVSIFLPVTLCWVWREQPVGLSHTLSYFRQQSQQLAANTARLKAQIDVLDPHNVAAVSRAKATLVQCRLNYKHIQFFLAYFFPDQALKYNSPPRLEAEEPFMEYEEPCGFQVIESLLFDADLASKMTDLHEQIELVNSTAADLPALLYQFKATDKQLFESLRMELVRVITLSITGFDAPELKTGIAEAHESVLAISEIIQPYLQQQPPGADSVRYYLKQSLNYLKAHPDFDKFNRLDFLTRAALPLQKALNQLAIAQHLDMPGSALSYTAPHLFSPAALRPDSLTLSAQAQNAMAQLGKQLFFEKALSGNGQRSCASCHQPEKYFADGLAKSTTLDGHGTVERNAPTLLYAGYQRAQFWDARVKTLEQQIKDVLLNPLEMNSVNEVVVEKLKNRQDYHATLQQAFPAQQHPVLSVNNIASAIASYVRTLNPYNSNFDRYMQGNKQALTREQQQGFNLFMGKAQCATCHYAPLFNGNIPPNYQLSELEVLGTTATDDLDHPVLDADEGRYKTYNLPINKAAFKTPGLRNVAVTAPYMHNGAFTTLEKVMDFYNKGGGQGLHLKVETQTLSPRPLNLTAAETKAIISFLNSLTDSYLPGQTKTSNIYHSK